LVEIVLDAGIGNLNAVVYKWQIKFVSHLLFDFGKVAGGRGFSLGIDSLLDFGFQFEVELDAKVLAPGLFYALSFLEIGAIDLAVVLDFAWFYQTRIEFLTLWQAASFADKALAGFRQSCDFQALDAADATIAAHVDGVDLDQTLLPQECKVAFHLRGVIAIDCLG
jgi:hypothetical protein